MEYLSSNYPLSSHSDFAPELTTEWLSPLWTATKTSGVGTALRQGVMVAGGSMAADWPTSTGSTTERMSRAMMESCGISMPGTTEVSNQPE